MSAPTPRPGTGRQGLLLAVVLVLGMALGVTHLPRPDPHRRRRAGQHVGGYRERK